MQYADDAELAAALAGGQTIEVANVLRFDWQRDGRFATAFADLSDVFVDATLDAQFTGQYPAEFEVNDGYAQRRFTVTVAGAINGVDAVTFFSPFAGFYGGQIGAVNTPMYYAIVVRTADGDREVRQFTGFLTEAHPKRSDGTVELECADVTSQLTNGITLSPTARSQAMWQWAQEPTDLGNDHHRQRGGQSLAWYLIHILRASGLYQGPKPPPGCVAYFTMTGGCLPEVGGMWQQPRDGRQSWPISDSSGWIMPAFNQRLAELPWYVDTMVGDDQPIYDVFGGAYYYPTSPWSPDIDTPDVYPLYMWQRGQFGPEMKMDCYNADSSLSGGKTDGMSFLGNTSDPITFTQGGRQRLYIGGWQRFDTSVGSGNVTSLYAVLSGFANIIENKANYGMVSFFADVSGHRLVADMVVYTWDGSTVDHWQRYYTDTSRLTNGVHYVGMCIEFVPGDVTPTLTLNIDGTELAQSWDSKGSAGYWYSTMKYAQVDGRSAETCPLRLSTGGGAQHWGIWVQDPVASASTPRVWSNAGTSADYTTTTDISPSEARTMFTPSVVGQPSWDVLKEIGSSDLGVIYTTEDGLLCYRNWTEINIARDQSKWNTELTLSDLADVDPYTTFNSIANQVTYTSYDSYFVDEAVFKATDPQQFTVASGRSARYQTTIDDTVSVLQGNVTPRRLAQGYYQTSAYPTDNPYNHNNANAYDFTVQDFMTAYAPDTWKNGFEGHNRGDVTNSQPAQPLEGRGVFASCITGWVRGDTDPRHLTILLYSSNPIGGRATCYAVDDNTAFLNIRGYKLEKTDNHNETVNSTDTSSFEHYGVRNISRPQSDWASDYYTQHDLTQKLADDLAQPRPVFSSIDTRGDPRRQLQDVVRIEDPGGIGGPIFASVVGINRKYGDDGVTETLALRTFANRAAVWVLGDPDFSILGQTTILGEAT